MVNGPNWQCCLAGSSQRAPRITIFSIVLGADYSFYVKNIETHARAFWPLNISAVGSVYYLGPAETLEGPMTSLALSVLSALLSKLKPTFHFFMLYS